MPDDIEDLSSLVGGFYDESKSHSGQYEIGQIVFVPVLEMRRKPFIADAIRTNSYTHSEVTLHIRDQNDDDFKGKEKRTPIKALRLDENHELVLSRAKCRPSLIIGKTNGIDLSTIPAGRQRDRLLNGFADMYLLAPIYSISTSDKIRAFGPVITARIKCLMYPEFIYMPRSGGILKVPGVARLDHLFVHALTAGINHTDLFAIDEIMAVAHEQLKILIGKEPSDKYLEARELLLEFLPDDYK